MVKGILTKEEYVEQFLDLRLRWRDVEKKRNAARTELDAEYRNRHDPRNRFEAIGLVYDAYNNDLDNLSWAIAELLRSEFQ